MRAKPQSPVWPYLGILACLFVLSITAPRAWDRMAQRDRISGYLAKRAPEPPVVRRWPSVCERIQPERVESLLEEPAGIGTEVPADFESPHLRRPDSNSAPVERAPSPEPKRSPAAPEPSQTASEDDAFQFAPDSPAQPPITFFNPAYEARPQVPAAPAPAHEGPPGPNLVKEVPPRESGLAGDLDLEVPDAAPELASGSWPMPRVLLEQLRDMAHADRNAAWAVESIELIQELCRNVDEDGRTPLEIVADLRSIASQPRQTPAAKAHAARAIRARYALTRWLDVWEPAASLDETRTASNGPSESGEDITQRIADVESQLRQGASGPAWRTFLRLDTVKQMAKDPHATAKQRRALARSVLDRIDADRLTQAQRRLVADGPIAALESSLREWAAEPVGSTRLLSHLDRYERTGLPSDARLVANDWRGLSWHNTQHAQNISRHIDKHYRNANIRVALSSKLMNRWIPQPEAVQSRVRDTIMNVPVRGRNTTFTKLFVRLLPDPHNIRVGLEASGVISSDTISSSGPARFRNAGQSTFLVRKLLVLGSDGLAVWPAVAEAENNYNRLISMETGFDAVPLVGPLIRGYARSQHDEMQGQARFQVEQKVAIRARDQFDDELQARLIKATRDVQDDHLATLQRLGLDLVPVSLSTTEERVVARVRAAGNEQLGAHTPRPRAPSDSWASLQVHQSALNNALESLDLAGRSFTIEELFTWIAEKLNRPELAEQEDLPEDVAMTFAKTDPIRLTCDGGRIEVAFTFDELSQGGQRWRNFTVRSFYHPQREGLTPRFVRDRGTIYLEGKSLRRKIVLRMIFSRVLSVNRDLNLLDESITTDSRLADMDISQFVVEHGWIGLAYSPKGPAANVARRPR